MIITDDKLDKEIIADYIAKERLRWHHIQENPYFDPNMPYELTAEDDANHNTAYFKGIRLKKVDDGEKDSEFSKEYRAANCRYIDPNSGDVLTLYFDEEENENRLSQKTDKTTYLYRKIEKKSDKLNSLSNLLKRYKYSIFPEELF